MALTTSITLPCGHKLVITESFLCYDVLTCRECRKVFKWDKKERKRIAKEQGFDAKKIKGGIHTS